MSSLIQVNGLYFFPPVFYEESSNLPDERDVSLIDKSMSQFPFNGGKLFVHNEGYLATNTDERDVSESILNSIFLSTSLLKYPVHRANKDELDILKIDSTSNKIKSSEGTFITIRGYLHAFPIIRREFRVVVVKKDEFKIICQLAEKIFNSKFKMAIFTFYESYTQYQMGDYTGSFLMSWMAIENYLSKRLEEHFQIKGVFQDLMDKLNHDWTVFKKLGYLKENDIISKNDYKEYDELRKIRNNIIHSDYKPTQIESKKCKDIANSAMWKLFKMDGIDYKYYHDEIQKFSS
jgi:hypothetical protein